MISIWWNSFILLYIKKIMSKNLLIRGISDQIHGELNKISKDQSVSINVIIKNAVEKWLQQKHDDLPKKHDLILYSGDKSLDNFLRSINKMTKSDGFFCTFLGNPNHSGVKTLTKFGWNNGTITPYEKNFQNTLSSYSDALKNITKQTNNAKLCCIDFIVSDVAAQKSLQDAIHVENQYNTDRQKGMIYCPYKIEDLVSCGISDMMELFDEHDQIFLVKGDQFYKLHVSRESIHKLFLD